MKRLITILIVHCLGLVMVSCSKSNNDGTCTSCEDHFIRGADLSFLPEIEQWGTKFYNPEGIGEDVISQMSENGCNTIRVRLWHSPANEHGSLAEVAALCQRVRQKGMKVLLDIHYSDTWADPGRQSMPAAWHNLTLNILADSLYNYTFKVLSLIRPEYVQIGNEINGGFVWEAGRISNQADFIKLLKSGIQAARDFSSGLRIIIHFAGLTGSGWFFGMLKTNDVDYDIMALSYYPVWHGQDLALVRSTIGNLVSLTSKEVMVVETAYPFTLNGNDNTNNITGRSDQLVQGYPATETGQLDFINEVKGMVSQTKNGMGFCYWGGEWVAFKGASSTDGSSWENQALFDFSNKALPVMQVFHK
jgi:arabinogalactan endo-1,4-beta-galactosidase